MTNIKNAGVWDKVKKFFNGDKKQYQQILQAIKKSGYNIKPEDLQVQNKNNNYYIEFANKNFILWNGSKESFDNLQKNKAQQLIDQIKKNILYSDGIDQLIINKLEEQLAQLKIISINNNKIMIEIV